LRQAKRKYRRKIKDFAGKVWQKNYIKKMDGGWRGQTFSMEAIKTKKLLPTGAFG
jgi:hypothetical protein